MRQLFQYILKHHFIFLFVILEVFSFILVLQNHYHQTVFINSTSKLTGNLFQTFNNFTEYFKLAQSNRILAHENARLRMQLKSSFLERDTSIYLQKDSLFRFITARVISNTVNKQKNYLMLDKGWRQGVKKDMGVISSYGVVGIVTEVGQNFSRIMSVLHVNNRINARIKKNRHLGTVEWPGQNYRIGLLTDIPTHILLYEGDTIITSGNSLVYPENIMIGTVQEYFSDQNQKFNQAYIEFSVDYNKLDYVYVVVNIYRDELKLLERLTE
jgi:rod shape-determining protein MreC